ncbi:MAG: nucleotide sugar dehydrogenase [Deltaproteobacteria bacterium]|nr:nucleotide sugar dehydrogenase [Deltaproteobacteria bacterium]MBN2670838.1 nucleotide sugar dehydrogenase [Deltaproteobacteria bacterium]
MKDALIGKINRKDAKVAVIGLGYVGLPLAVSFANAGFSTVGIDTSSQLVSALREQHSHVRDITDAQLADAINKGLHFSDSYTAVADCDCISIAVPTPLTKSKEPDISYITAAVDALLPHLTEGVLVVLESTTYPGTTDELLGARIQAARGLNVGEHIFVAFSPERVDPGNPTWKIKNTPKVIGGVTPHCTEVAHALYARTIDKVHCVQSAKEAETVKLLENTFRAVNIGLVNEFLLMCHRMDIDIWNVIEAAATKPFGFMPFFPGPGIGGHCIPLDPMYMSWKAKSVDFYNRFIELATDINGNMPRFVISKLSDILNNQKKPLNGSRIAVLGLSYKKNVSDMRESPGMEIVSLLQQKGCEVFLNDPLIPVRQTADSADRIAIEDLAQTDAAVLVTDHDTYNYAAIAETAPVILDCRNAFAKRGITHVKIYKL